MTGKTHQLLGFTAVYTLALLSGLEDVNIQTLVVGIMLVSLGGLVPDLDNQDNKIYTLVPVGQRAFSEVFERVFGKHRSISHSILGLGLIGYGSWWLLMQIPIENGLDSVLLWWTFMIAVATHVGADMYTIDGVPLLWPLKIKFYGIPVKFLRVRTGSWVEFGVVGGGAMLIIMGMTYIFWSQVVALFTF